MFRPKIKGEKFNRLTAIRQVESQRCHGTMKRFWLFRCDCGNKKVLQSTLVVSGRIKSCGCLVVELAKRATHKTHGMYGTHFYVKWNQMLVRCHNENSKSYEYYGARGIKTCKKWHKFENFMEDMYDEYLGHLKKYGKRDTTIDRINNNLGYNKKNCRFATMKQQANNKTNNIK